MSPEPSIIMPVKQLAFTKAELIKIRDKPRPSGAKSGLNKSILDQGWSLFAVQLDYKLAWRGGELVRVPPQNTSRTCPACGHIDKNNRKTQSEFVCVACGHAGHADHVAAINIRAAGHAVLACGEKVLSGLSMKQEPAEGVQAVA